MRPAQKPPRCNGAKIILKRDRPLTKYYVFERSEIIRNDPKSMPGASKHLAEMPWIESLPEKGDDRAVNVLEGLELHEGVVSAEEEAALVGRVRGKGGGYNKRGRDGSRGSPLLPSAGEVLLHVPTAPTHRPTPTPGLPKNATEGAGSTGSFGQGKLSPPPGRDLYEAPSDPGRQREAHHAVRVRELRPSSGSFINMLEGGALAETTVLVCVRAFHLLSRLTHAPFPV